jgi:hypothetical protein
MLMDGCNRGEFKVGGNFSVGWGVSMFFPVGTDEIENFCLFLRKSGHREDGDQRMTFLRKRGEIIGVFFCKGGVDNFFFNTVRPVFVLYTNRNRTQDVFSL